MKRIEDERIQFYLRHESLIEEWAQIRSDAVSAAHRFYLSLAEDLEERAADLGDDILVLTADESWARVGLCRESWLDESGTPLAVLSLEWMRSKTGFREGYRVLGVRCDADLEVGRQLRGTIADLVREQRSVLGFGRSSRWWPAYKAVDGTTDAEYWLDLDPFRQALVEGIVEAWWALSPSVDEALSSNSRT